ncbi:hypothetical protein RCJ22_37200, partial [Vibrio sp. FNV 38]|nr:hypothetical protein [Vibrio sp. FNV 38]
ADFDTAMKVLGFESGTFYRALNPTLMFVAADTTEKRRAFDPVIEVNYPLSESTDPGELTEMVRLMRELTGVQHIQQNLATRSITVKDSPQKVRLAGAILRELSAGRGELLLQIDLLEVDRNKARNMGVT